MELESIITHKNLGKYLDALNDEPYFQIGVKGYKLTGKEWFHKPVILEFPLGELARDGLTNLVLIGIGPKPEPLSLTGKEGFNAQGLEGKVQVEKPLFNALMAMRDILPVRRGRIITNPESRIVEHSMSHLE